MKPVQQPSLDSAQLESLTPITVIYSVCLCVCVCLLLCLCLSLNIYKCIYTYTDMDRENMHPLKYARIGDRDIYLCIYTSIYSFPVHSLPTPIASEMRKWNAIFREKTDLSWGLSRKWRSLPPIQTSRHSSAALFQCSLLFKVHSLRLNEPPSAKRKGPTSMATDALLSVSALHGRKNELRLFKTSCPIIFFKKMFCWHLEALGNNTY